MAGYKPRLSLSGPGKPLFSWETLMKQNEERRKGNKLFPSGKPHSFKWDTSVAERAAKDAADLAKRQAEYERQLAEDKAYNERKKQEHDNSIGGKIDNIGHAIISDIVDITKAIGTLGIAAGSAAIDNSWRLDKDIVGLAKFGDQTVKTTLDAYSDIGPVKGLLESYTDFSNAVGNRDLGGAASAAYETALRGTMMGPVTDKVLGGHDTDLGALKHKIAEHPVFYAMDIAPAVGAVGRGLASTERGARIIASAETKPAIRQIVAKSWRRKVATDMAATKEVEGARLKLFMRSAARLDPNDAVILSSAIQGLHPVVEREARNAAIAAMEAGKPFTRDIKQSKVLVELADEIGPRYDKFVKQFVTPYSKLLNEHRIGELEFSELDAEVRRLKASTDKDLRHLADAYDTNALATLKAWEHRGIEGIRAEVRTRRPQMELLGYRTIAEVKDLMEGIPVGGMAAGAKPGELAFAVPIKTTKGKKGRVIAIEVKVVNNRGHIVRSRTITADAGGFDSWMARNKLTDAEIERTTRNYYDRMFASIDKELGNEFQPLYWHHEHTIPGMGRSALQGGVPKAGASGAMQSDMVLFRDGTFDRMDVRKQTGEFGKGLNTYMRGKMLNALIDSAKRGKPGAEIITDPTQMAKYADDTTHKVITPKDKDWSTWEDIIFAGDYEAMQLRKVFPELDLKIDPGKPIHALVIDKNLDTYLERMTGLIEHAPNLLEKATSVWKFSVLSMRPAFVVNNVVGNQVLAMLHDPRIVWDQVLNTYARVDKPMARELRGNYRFLSEHFGDALESFGHSESLKGPIKVREYKNQPLNMAAQQFRNVVNVGFTLSRMHEEALRSSIIMTGMRRDARIKALMNKDRLPNVEGNTKLERAFQQLSKDDPAYARQLRDDLAKGTNLTLGNYSYYSPLERGLKMVIPFYGWYRHITKFALKEYTGKRAPMHVAMARMAQDYPELATFPAFTANFIPFQKDLPGAAAGENGRERYLDLTPMNPFATIPEVVKAFDNLAFGKPGQGSEVWGMVNPVVTTLIEQGTGRNLRTGATVEDSPGRGLMQAIARPMWSLPQMQLLKKMGGDVSDPLANYDPHNPDTWQTEQGRVSTKGVNPTSFGKSVSTAFYRFFGVPIQDVNREQLESLAKRLEERDRPYPQRKLPTPPKPRRHKGDPKPPRTTLNIIDIARQRGLPVPIGYNPETGKVERG